MTEKLENLLANLEAIHRFKINATPDDYEKCFGKMGSHLWNKYVNFHYDFMRFWSYLDFANQDRLGSYILKWYNEHYK